MQDHPADWTRLSKPEQRARLIEIAIVFLTLGTIAFGGPAAHIAMMNQEIVEKRKWLSRQKFLELLGATNLIPGPNSTELAIHIGYQRAGWLGLVLAGSCFILPAMVIVLILAILYTKYEMVPGLAWILYGIKPVILAIVLQALWNLAAASLRSKTLWAVAISAAVLALIGLHELALLLIAGIVCMILANGRKLRNTSHSLIAPAFFSALLPVAKSFAPATKLFWIFLKIGAVLYGSGYVLLAFLQKDFVDRWGIITSQQLLDAVAIGQFTPGPVFTTATFIGYLVAGIPGAIAGTVSIFLPAFLFVAVLTFWMDRLRQSPWVASFIDGVTAASLALMAIVSGKLGLAAVVDISTALILLASLFVVFRFKINSAWLVAAGGLLGLLRYLFFTL